MHGLSFARAALGRERCSGGDFPRHRHAEGYLTLVLAGGYFEAGDAGRFQVEAGHALNHRPYEAHCDYFAGAPTELINLPLPANAPGLAVFRAADPDAVARLAETDLEAAAALLCIDVRPASPESDWPDRLAAALRRRGAVRIGEWASSQGLAAATVSRSFQQAFGTTPARYRAEARARLAWRAITGGEGRLADIAYDLGFADQAHMTRSVVSLTGRPPADWRRLRKSIQDRRQAAT